mmetsp:Transcript_7945/g.19878  ORF Transcript_7945/g.19878 Transcript_7945/m.19878 type:complete len:378 (+) Transcript_7945:348-1481(+)|eukprot:CAMPEP_0113451942 /NCGR_PEP_ID=MMETSP0014_2-20120614/6594_1 /TAXON_ID=2857 /ORGANISM="Nitzschia sp." /LENGTH=377 /DNA_ID=CAMNT_0000343305 /DNA_START=609 /DNA_END=1742 /DNA_ORIENTATION=- /assembly_acc=CAM_ASM_000159
MEHKQELGHEEPMCVDHKLVMPDGDRHVAAVPVEDEQEVSFFHDFVAGGVAGTASVIVGHPLDSIKVRLQTSTSTGPTSISSLVGGYGGISSLFRGMSAPLSTACIINAIIFSSYGWSSRMYDEHFPSSSHFPNNAIPIHDSTIKAFTCGSFAGLVQGLVICPQEHVKCRLQVQHGKGSADNLYKGPIDATRSIIKRQGLFKGLYRGWCITVWREVPAFGAYFACYDILKDKINSFFVKREEDQQQQLQQQLDAAAIVAAASGNNVIATDDNSGSLVLGHHAHTWLSSALAGGTTGALTWAMVYPFDVIKTRIQTMPLDAPIKERRISAVTRNLVHQYGWRYLFRGLGVTCFRAFPVNGIIFPVYEYTLMQVCALEY